MKRLILVALALMGLLPAMAQTPKFRNAYYDCRRAAHTREGMPRSAIVWLGDSITEQGWWSYLSNEQPIVNRGIGGDNTYGMLDRLPEILDFAPRKLFIMAGVNDLSAGYPVEHIYANIRAMVDMIRERVPACEIYIQSLITPNNEILAYDYVKNKQEQIRMLNTLLQELCTAKGITWVDIASILSNEQGEVRIDLTKDGIHLHPEAYLLWVKHLKQMHYLAN